MGKRILACEFIGTEERDAGSGEFGFDLCDGAVEVDGAAGFAKDSGFKAEAAGVEG